LLLLLIVVVAISEDQDTTGSQKQDRSEDKPKKTKSDVGVGEAATMNDRVLRVEDVERSYRSPRELDRPDPGNEFVRVQITLSNTSNQTFSINPLDFEFQDSAGVQRENEHISDLPNRIDLGSIAPGGTLRGHMVFEAPQGDSNLKLVYTRPQGRGMYTPR
jgi:hypothetical protein